jgi:hypothetical protein
MATERQAVRIPFGPSSRYEDLRIYSEWNSLSRYFYDGNPINQDPQNEKRTVAQRSRSVLFGCGSTTIRKLNGGKMSKDQKCVLCGDGYAGHGHNAQPLKDGRCCEGCNIEKVIPERVRAIRGLKWKRLK